LRGPCDPRKGWARAPRRSAPSPAGDHSPAAVNVAGWARTPARASPAAQ